MLDVNEIFYSIQGESTLAGRPCVFIRLSHCNLRCSYCDTGYAFGDGELMPVESVIGKVRAFGCNLVEVTGGEPLLQASSLDLMKALCDEAFEVLLETGGSLDIGKVDPRVRRIVDFKTPSSLMEDKNLWENVRFLKQTDEVKFVIGDKGDYEWAKEKITRHNLTGSSPLLMAPVFNKLKPLTLSEWILKDRLDVRLQLQLHKYIWKPEEKGV